jgi:glycosyltransferase involved in cell wall biosynthesis
MCQHRGPNSPANPVVLFAGQLIRGKGVDLLLVAMQKLKNPARLRIVGKETTVIIAAIVQESGLWERTEFVN